MYCTLNQRLVWKTRFTFDLPFVSIFIQEVWYHTAQGAWEANNGKNDTKNISHHIRPCVLVS
jgi:hypothetical protein